MNTPSTQHAGRILRGVYVNAYGQGVVATTQLAGVPILLHYWGPAVYGEWLILFAIPAYLSILDLGFPQTAANYMSQRVARGDSGAALLAFQGLAVLVLLSAVLGFCIAICLALLPLHTWLSLHEISPPAVQLVLLFLAVEVVIKLTEGASHAGFRASGEYPFHMGIYYTTFLLQHAGVWVLAMSGFGPVTAALSFLVVRALVTPSVALLLVRRHPWLVGAFKLRSLRNLRHLIRPAIGNTTFPLATALNIQGVVVVVGIALGPLSVVTYTALRTLSRLSQQTVQSLSNAAEPELAAAHGTDNRGLQSRLLEHLLRMAFWFGVSILVVLMLSVDSILSAWTHGNVVPHYALFAFLLAAATFGGIWHGAFTVLKSANLHTSASYAYVLASVLAVIGSFVGASSTGRVEIVGFTLLIVDLLMMTITVGAAAAVCGISTKRLLCNAANPLPLVALLKRGASGGV